MTQFNICDFGQTYRNFACEISLPVYFNLTDEQVAELGIDNNVLRKLINDAMIRYLAKTYDFDVSEEKIISYVKRTSYFRNAEGEFDLSVFKAAFNK